MWNLYIYVYYVLSKGFTWMRLFCMKTEFFSSLTGSQSLDWNKSFIQQKDTVWNFTLTKKKTSFWMCHLVAIGNFFKVANHKGSTSYCGSFWLVTVICDMPEHWERCSKNIELSKNYDFLWLSDKLCNWKQRE